MSWTRQTTTAAISIGLPALSLTLRRSPLRLCARSESFFLLANGLTQKNPLRLTVPR